MPMFEDLNHLSATDTTYDFVIVGGGTAGNVLASRLSEDSNLSVLVLEAGGSHENATETQIPFDSVKLGGSKYDWNYNTAPQASLGGRTIPYTRGHVLGGCSAINHMAYTRGSADDFDRYAQVTGDAGWSWSNMLPYFQKHEKFSGDIDGHHLFGKYDPSGLGTTGVNDISLPVGSRGCEPIIEAAFAEFQDEFAHSHDLNSGCLIGSGHIPLTVKDGARSSSATAYLTSDVLSRPNLHILVNAQVTKLIKTGSTNVGLSFKDVEFVQKGKDTREVAHATKEVILCGGAIGTPSILLHSGIGEAGSLKALGIPSLLDLPSVGQNLTDHPCTALGWLVDSEDTFDTFQRDPASAEAAIQEWTESKTGSLATPVLNQLGFFRFSEATLSKLTKVDPAPGPQSPHFEMMFYGGALPLPPPPTGNYLMGLVAVTQPTSLGSVSLASNDPLAHPIIQLNLLSTEYDRAALREAFKTIRRFAKAPALKSYLAAELTAAVPNVDAAIDEYIKSTGFTVYHPVGTAKMTSKDATDGVVNPDLRVKGTTGLRIVDASVFPFIPSAHTQAPVYAFAERAADLIKAVY